MVLRPTAVQDDDEDSGQEDGVEQVANLHLLDGSVVEANDTISAGAE